jgi:hypothetical protein
LIMPVIWVTPQLPSSDISRSRVGGSRYLQNINQAIAARDLELFTRNTILPHDMFTPERSSDGAAADFQKVWLLEVVVHGWDDWHCHRLLSHVPARACFDDKVLVADAVMLETNLSFE